MEKTKNFIFGRQAKLRLVLLCIACSVCGAGTVLAQSSITGTVSDLSGPMPGVSVFVKGTSVGMTTGADGRFTLTVPDKAALVFSFVGYVEQEISVGDRTIIDVTMLEDVSKLDEVVVIGYGSAKKRDLTGSIVSLDGKTVADKPSTNPLASVQGRVAGVQVVNTGRAGQDPEIRIRGTNSINGYTPLYIVDGLFTDNINYLNPADIESMEILKDASSLAIFGIRGANGAIIISTKRAKEGQTVVNINSSVGLKHVADRLPMTNAAQFKELYNEQLINQGVITPFDYTNWQADTDWQDEIFQTGFLNINNISITGATAKSKFYAGLGYTTEEGSIKSEKMTKITLNMNSEYKVKDYLKVGFQINGSRTLPPDAKGVTGVLKAAPIAPSHYDWTDPLTGKTERLLHTLPDFQRAQASNPVRDIEILGNHNIGVNHRVAGNVFGELNFLKHFTFKATWSMDFRINEARDYTPVIWEYNPDAPGADKKTNVTDRESVNQSKSTNISTQQDYILTYENKWGKHGLTAMAGLTTNYKEYSSLNGRRSQLVDNIYFSPEGNTDKWWLSAMPDIAQTNGSSQWRRFTMSYLARGLYNYNNRYLLNASFRLDGSSVFRGVGNTWDNFYSFGAGWIVSEESFMRNQELVNYLKLKGSWGVLGSENTGGNNYPTYPILTSSGSAVFGDETIQGYAAEFLVQNLKWEKTYSYEVGFEMKLLKHRLSIEPVYYSKTTKDIIVSLASRSGAKNSLENLGEIRNKGFELAVSWNDRLGDGDFRYSIGANLTTINNEVLSLGRDEGDAKYEGVARTLAGFPISHFYGYEVEGVYQTWTDILQSPSNNVYAVKPGDLKFKDIDSNGEITAADRTMIGNPTPDFTYGFNINLGYGGIDLSMDFMGVYGNEIYRDWGTSTYAQLNYQERHLDRWHGKGTSNWEPILDPSRSVNNVASSYFVEDGSFFRVRNIQLGYTFPKSILQKIHLQSLRIFANAQNLKTWHKNSGYTPEVGGSALKFGIDGGGYPMPAIYTFGINLSF